MISLNTQSTNATSRDLEQRIVLFLQQRQLVFGSRLWVEAADGIVTLSGRVPSFHQRQLIYAFTRRVAGVVQVIDRLEVDPPRVDPPLVTASSAAGSTQLATVIA